VSGLQNNNTAVLRLEDAFHARSECRAWAGQKTTGKLLHSASSRTQICTSCTIHLHSAHSVATQQPCRPWAEVCRIALGPGADFISDYDSTHHLCSRRPAVVNVHVFP
jgi:hypothetical protein